MPIIKSAQKRMRQTEKRKSQNVTTKQNMRSAIKNFTASLEKGGVSVTEALREAQSAIDTAVKKNILHKNTAARKKSALAAKAKVAGAKPATAKKAPAKTAASKKPASAVKPAAKKTPSKKA